MAIIVNTNMTALKTQKNLNNATNRMGSALERMSTGYKINRAKDDAAGLYVATGLDNQIRGSKVAKDNIATGNNVLQTIEGDLDAMLTNLNRIRDLATQAANSVYSADAMLAMQQEIESRCDEIDRISLASNFNGLNLLAGDGTDPLEIAGEEAKVNDPRLAKEGLRLQVGANADKHANSIKLDATFFAATNSNTLGVGTIVPDYQTEITDAMSIRSGMEEVFRVTSGMTAEAKAAGIADGSISPSASMAASYIAILDTAINDISNRKSTIGATMNRLESAEASLDTVIENATAAKSTIMDADIAEESAEYTKQQILQQTSAALLVQANALPQIAISLVQG